MTPALWDVFLFLGSSVGFSVIFYGLLHGRVDKDTREEPVKAEKRVECPICNRTFKNAHGLSVHIARKH